MILRSYLSNYCEQLIPFTYVSFDIFDTLMFRTVSDFRMIHQMVANLYEEQYGISLPLYPKQRMDAELKARNVLGRNEVNMDMIFEYLSDYSEEEKSRLRFLEEKCEIDNCVGNPLMIEVWKWCRDNGKKIVIITDMYLPRRVLNTILAKIGVDYDYLYISGEEGVTKRTSELFAVVLRKLNIKPTQLIHIGADLNNDINMPQIKGIASLLRLSNEANVLPYIKIKQCDISLGKDHLFSMLSRYCSNREFLNSEQRIGYAILMLRYGLMNYDELTQKDVAKMMGISQSYISRLEKKIIFINFSLLHAKVFLSKRSMKRCILKRLMI